MIPLSDLDTLSLEEFTDALTPLFESAPVLSRALYAARPFASYSALIDSAETLALSMTDAEQVDVANAHPRIGAPPRELSASSAREQSAAVVEDPSVLADLARLNDEYEAKFGFRFVVFVNKRPRSAIRDVLVSRISRSRSEELATGLAEMFAIARDRLATLSAH